MSTLNLEAPIDPTTWTALQSEVCMNVANAKFYAFAAECERMAEFMRLGFVNRQTAADYLYQTAAYNQLYFEYGTDRIQKIMAAALESRAA